MSLTKREVTVLMDAALGLTMEDTALFLGLSPQTIKFERMSIIKKLNASNTTHAVYIAVKKGIIR